MDNEKISAALLDIAETELAFTIIQSGKASKKVNGLYKLDTHEIILHNKNFKSDNALMYTAIHEYAHHLIAEETLRATGVPAVSSRVHTQRFWERFAGLLETAEKKGYYVIGLEKSPELEQLTDEIKKKYLTENGRLMYEFGKALARAFDLCEQADIRYEDYVDRVLGLPRTAAHDILELSAVHVNPAIGYENMKTVAKIRNPEQRATAEAGFLRGKSPDAVRAGLKKSTAIEKGDVKAQLQKEKNRLEKTIASLAARLEAVEERLARL
ncbi:MAG: hypothetical protein IJ191_05510 [Treponema sp.]|nr:hypothetical protein [Treponema sp.]